MASVVDNLDHDGDIARRGAFSKSLSSGTSIPLAWMQKADDPRFYFGDVVEATETDDGMAIKGRFDLDTEFGKSVYRNTKGRRVSGLSIGYRIRNSTKTAAGNELTELLIEMASAVFAHDGGGHVAPQPRASKHSQPLPIPSQKQIFAYSSHRERPSTY